MEKSAGAKSAVHVSIDLDTYLKCFVNIIEANEDIFSLVDVKICCYLDIFV